jgi:anti-sigma factor ChrR (cupin superfamily)
MSDNDRLVEYSLGLLKPEQGKGVEAELADSEALREELQETSAALAQLADATDPVAPSTDLRDRLLASLEPERRFDHLIGRLTRFLDLPVNEVEGLLRSGANPADGGWRMSGIPGMRAFRFEGGPNIATADCQMLHMEPGFRFPAHRHGGNEWGFVLQGSIEEDGGALYGAGDIVHKPPASRHSFWIPGKQATLLIVLLEGVIEWLEDQG